MNKLNENFIVLIIKFKNSKTQWQHFSDMSNTYKTTLFSFVVIPRLAVVVIVFEMAITLLSWLSRICNLNKYGHKINAQMK